MIAKYRATGNYLEELLDIDEPIEPSALSYPQDDWGYDRAMNRYRIELAEYKGHLEYLRRIPCHPSCVGKWSDGEILEEGKDYEVRDDTVWPDHHQDVPVKRLFAFPLPVKSEDDLWEEFEERLAKCEPLSELKKEYTLTKK